MTDGPCYRPGEWVIYRRHKHTASPGPRAKDVTPEPNGEEYSYSVDKYWIVVSVENDNIVLATRRRKLHVVDADDPNLRPARWWERLLFRDRFPPVQELATVRSA